MATKTMSGVAVVVCLLWASGSPAAPVSAPGFDVVEAMIPMRDGVRLHTVIYSPAGARGALPVLYQRTPYNADSRGNALGTSLRELVDDGYLFVFQDIRGKFGSEGEFAMIRAPRDPADPKAID